MPHMNNGWWFWGMHLFWWLFWIVLIVLIFWLSGPLARNTARGSRETPLEILQRRYAAGEISTEEYEERKSRLERDRPLA
jgi:putative membrane protein